MVLDDACILYIDGGTTRTRVWAAVGEGVVAAEQVTVGARDTAREGSSRQLGEALRQMIGKINDRCDAQGRPHPTLGVAAGMITSGQGLVEVPHVEAPAGPGALAEAARTREIPEVAALPIVFLPGVRSGVAELDREAIGQSDVMRGEEVLGLGLAARGPLAEGGLLLSLGSHWKAVQVDGDGRIARSTSTLGGEMTLAIQSHTILASSVSRDWPATLPMEWVDAGRGRCRLDGLPRALYCVRLLEQRTPSSPKDRLAFLVGAMIAGSENALLPVEGLPSSRVALVGPPAAVEAWARIAAERGLHPVAVDEAEKEAAFRAGCRAVLAHGGFPPP